MFVVSGVMDGFNNLEFDKSLSFLSVKREFEDHEIKQPEEDVLISTIKVEDNLKREVGLCLFEIHIQLFSM